VTIERTAVLDPITVNGGPAGPVYEAFATGLFGNTPLGPADPEHQNSVSPVHSSTRLPAAERIDTVAGALAPGQTRRSRHVGPNRGSGHQPRTHTMRLVDGGLAILTFRGIHHDQLRAYDEVEITSLYVS